MPEPTAKFYFTGRQLKHNNIYFFPFRLAMAQESSLSPKDVAPTENEADKSKESLHPIDLEELDVPDDDLILPSEGELAKKVVVRRKIEMYWEKKRLQEQIGDFGEIDLDF